MQKIKRLIAMLLVVTLVATTGLLTTGASAATRDTKAKALSELGLFMGYDESGSNFGLTNRATREHALVFLIRMLGEEKAALAWTGSQPYSDVPAGNHYHSYVGYAKEKGYTVGIGENKFGLGQYANMQQMTTFALRGLGYSDASDVKDFTVGSSLTFAVEKGILTSDTAIAPFTRGEAVDILFGSITAKIKNQSYDLISKLMNNGAVTQAQYTKAMATIAGTTGSVAVTGVKLSQSAISLEKGSVKQLTGTISPTTASNKNVTWSSNNTAVATVDANGYVAGVKAGTATITVKTVDGNKTTTCLVTVTDGSSMTTANFTIYNNTGKSITELYISDANTDHFGSDYLSSGRYGTFDNGKSITTSLSFYGNTKYDIMIRFGDGSQWEAYDMNTAGATSAGGSILFNNSNVQFNSPSTTLSTVSFNVIHGATTSDTTATSNTLTRRYQAAVERYNSLRTYLSELDYLGDYRFSDPLKQIYKSLSGDMASIIGVGSGIYTQAQINDFNAQLDTLNRLMNQLQTLAEQLRNQEVQSSQPRTVTFTIVNQTQVELTGIYVEGSNIGSMSENASSRKTTSLNLAAGDDEVSIVAYYAGSTEPLEYADIDFSGCPATGGVLTLVDAYDVSTSW